MITRIVRWFCSQKYYITVVSQSPMYVVVLSCDGVADIDDTTILMVNKFNINVLLLPELSLVYLKLKYGDSIIAQVTLEEADTIADCIAAPKPLTQKDNFVLMLADYIVRYKQDGRPLEHLLADMGLLNNLI